VTDASRQKPGLREVYVVWLLFALAAVAVFALATALLAAVMPARAAARLAPGEAIRLSR